MIGLPTSARRPNTHPATRMCVGCRQREERSALLRVVAELPQDGRQVVVSEDPRGRLPGRGAWLHPTPECLHLAVRRHAFARALRVTAPVDVGRLTEWVLARHRSAE